MLGPQARPVFGDSPPGPNGSAPLACCSLDFVGPSRSFEVPPRTFTLLSCRVRVVFLLALFGKGLPIDRNRGKECIHGMLWRARGGGLRTPVVQLTVVSSIEVLRVLSPGGGFWWWRGVLEKGSYCSI